MSTNPINNECCPKFDPIPWDNQVILKKGYNLSFRILFYFESNMVPKKPYTPKKKRIIKNQTEEKNRINALVSMKVFG